jgi:hypothetical protein
MRYATIIDFSGHFSPPRFLEFADHRAQRLDLGLSVRQADASRISVAIEGEPDLIDAFEMACSLGPMDCLVRDVARSDTHVRGGE